nr:MAG TPA_asm: hypothetical protein [Caudoviricetes sp.]
MGSLQLGAGVSAHTAGKFSERKKTRGNPKRACACVRAVGGRPRATAARTGGRHEHDHTAGAPAD